MRDRKKRRRRLCELKLQSQRHAIVIARLRKYELHRTAVESVVRVCTAAPAAPVMREAHRRRRTLDRKPHSTEIVCTVPANPRWCTAYAVHSTRSQFLSASTWRCTAVATFYSMFSFWDCFACAPQDFNPRCCVPPSVESPLPFGLCLPVFLPLPVLTL